MRPISGGTRPRRPHGQVTPVSGEQAYRWSNKPKDKSIGGKRPKATRHQWAGEPKAKTGWNSSHKWEQVPEDHPPPGGQALPMERIQQGERLRRDCPRTECASQRRTTIPQRPTCDTEWNRTVPHQFHRPTNSALCYLNWQESTPHQVVSAQEGHQTGKSKRSTY